MTQEEKELLLKDLCERLPYKVNCAVFDKALGFGGFNGKYPLELDGVTIEKDGITIWLQGCNFNIENCKPYLRSMSSMTEEEKQKMSDGSANSQSNLSLQRVLRRSNSLLQTL